MEKAKKGLKRSCLIMLFLIVLIVFMVFFTKTLVENGILGTDGKLPVTAVMMLILFICYVDLFVIIFNIFRISVLYCEKLALDKGLPREYKWFGLLLLIGIVILMWSSPVNINGNIADELGKYKKLYDEGVITEEEFLSKKEELLDRK